jgi:hypothetical protein
MSHRYLCYLRHGQDSSSDDEKEEDIIATLHAAQAQHDHMSTPHWGSFVLGHDYVHHDREVVHLT